MKNTFNNAALNNIPPASGPTIHACPCPVPRAPCPVPQGAEAQRPRAAFSRSAGGRIEAVMLGTRVVLRLRAQLEFVTLLHREDQFPWLGVQPIRKPEEAR